MTHNIKPLLIAGGFSTGTGTPKHLMPHNDGRPLYQHTLEHLINALPLTDTFYISLRDEDQTSDLDLAGSHKISKHVEPIYDPTSVPVGPAAGLIAAHICAPSATWLIVGCDCPLLTAHTLQQLVQEYVPPVTCFGNGRGFLEPLLVVWSPQALGRLVENVAAGKCGPGMTVGMYVSGSNFFLNVDHVTNCRTCSGSKWLRPRSRCSDSDLEEGR